MRSKTGILWVLFLAALASICPFSNAFATPTPVNNASLFLEEAAAEAGLTSGELIATMSGAIAISTGMSLGVDNGIKLGNSASQNLNNLIEAADYPDYSTLTNEQQTLWGSKENYDAAKFNSLMGAFGLASDRDGFYGSGGGNFEFSQNAKDRLQQFGRIGSLWVNRAAASFEDVRGTVSNTDVVKQYYGVTDNELINSNNYDDWPSGVPNDLYINKGNILIYQGTFTQYYEVTNIGYWVVFRNSSNASIYWSVVTQTESQIAVYNNEPTFGNMTSTTYNGKTYWYQDYSQYPFVSNNPSLNMTISGTLASTPSWLNRLHWAIIYYLDKGTDLGELTPNIADYPDEVPSGTTNVYFPSSGLTPIASWPMFLTAGSDSGDGGNGSVVDLSEIIALLQQFQFYSNGDLKVHDLGVYDALSDIGTQLDLIISKIGLGSNTGTQIQTFDWGPFQTKSELLGQELEELAPFGAIFLVSNLVETVSEIAVISEPKLEIPFNFFPGNDETIEIDLSWIDDGRAVINVFVILSLMLSLAAVSIRFIEIEVG